ncbi:hypothetical protein GGX14DRAFT_460002 [Mycena pura]|uniref:Uncharacterized protein n=1 Tax=Mycena pura TaxID=153505 RepID=A0AAD6VAQ2_9AGAR|nr:hypothetical protein GGX14DRAFT_460002 [Mycena pura]
MVVAVAKLLEADGQEVVQLSFLDHFPALWINDEPLLRKGETAIDDMAAQTFACIIRMIGVDPAYSGCERAAQMELALSASPQASQDDIATKEVTTQLTIPLLQFLMDFYPPSVPRCATGKSFADPFIDWVSSVKAPLSILIAEFGVVTTLPAALQASWRDLGAHLCRKAVDQYFIPGAGHFGFLGEAQTAALLQQLGR